MLSQRSPNPKLPFLEAAFREFSRFIRWGGGHARNTGPLLVCDNASPRTLTTFRYDSELRQ